MDLPLLLAYSLWGPVVCIIVLGVLIGCTLNTGQCGGDFFFFFFLAARKNESLA